MSVTVYPAFSRVPLDDPPEWEGDDTIALRSAERLTPVRSLSSFSVAPSVSHNVVVPYVEVEAGDRSDAVYALKRANARFRGSGRLALLQSQPGRVRRTWGTFFTRELRETQRMLKVTATGKYDVATWRALAPYYDAYAVTLLHVNTLQIPAQVGALLAWMQTFYSTRLGKRYTQLRPSQLLAAEKITAADCSGMVAGGMAWAKILRAVDWRWTNTDTQIHFGESIASLTLARVGDTVLYGHGSDPNHEALLVSLHPTPTVLSFGSYPARLLPVDYDRGERGGRIAIRRNAQW